MSKSSWRILALFSMGALVILDLAVILGWGDNKVPWFTSRAAGITAYILLAASTISGLLTSSRLFSKWVKPPVTLELHSFLTFLALAAIALHGVALLYDSYFDFHLMNLVVPFTGPYRPVAVGIGIIGAYLLVLLTWSFYVRRHIGQKVWRAFHYAGFLGFALALAHALLAGSDRSSPWIQLVYLGSGAIVLFLTYVRILGGRYIPSRPKLHRTRPTSVTWD